jgi:hypothetical protein
MMNMRGLWPTYIKSHMHPFIGILIGIGHKNSLKSLFYRILVVEENSLCFLVVFMCWVQFVSRYRYKSI